ncbi:hypothetical protein B0H14DRAFT_2631058 [Mycena olivaceomarginata]|nr:hypothetical protein B0H14DRAFT_2631058 [Mycena olivaceomarginata]
MILGGCREHTKPSYLELSDLDDATTFFERLDRNEFHLASEEGKIYAATMVKRKCDAATAVLVPLDEETIPIAIVVPKHLCPHTHPPPPATRVPTDVRLLYKRAVRAYGISVATVKKVEQDGGRRETGPSSGRRKGMQGQLKLKKNPDKVRKRMPRQGTEVMQFLRVHKLNWLEAAASHSSKGNDLGKFK